VEPAPDPDPPARAPAAAPSAGPAAVDPAAAPDESRHVVPDVVPDAPAAPRRRRTGPRPPWPAVVLAAVAVVLVGLPLVGLVARAPWSDLGAILGDPLVRDALRLSLTTSLAATALAALVGIPLAWCQARIAYPGRRLVRALVTLPLVLPPVVGGIALLAAFGRRGVAGPALDAVGVRLPFTMWGAVAAEAFVALPFLVVSAEAGFRAVDPELEEAARTLGARPGRVFWRVTVPAARPALVAGAVLAWARALGEFGATITFAGNYPRTTQTLPLLVYVRIQAGDARAATAVSVLLMAVSLVALLALRDRWWGAAGGTSDDVRLAGAGARTARSRSRSRTTVAGGVGEVPGDATGGVAGGARPRTGRVATDQEPGDSTARAVARGLRARVVVRRGGFDLDVAVDAPAGETTVVVGPNGAGKTSLLRALAGLDPAAAGRVAIGDDVVDDAARDRFVAPEDRAVGVVFQRHALFPHLSVLDNVAFGPRARGARRAGARALAAEALAGLGIGHLAGRPVRSLSGGQAQQVALARALVGEPRALLLDEPFAALDVRTRAEVRRTLAAALARFAGPVVLVTHDPTDAVVLADRVTVVEGGRVVQAGDLASLAARPASPYVAELVGTNRLVGRAGPGGSVALPGGVDLVAAAGGRATAGVGASRPGELGGRGGDGGPGGGPGGVDRPGGADGPAGVDGFDGPGGVGEMSVGDEVVVLVAPRSVSLHRSRPEGSPRNVWPATVASVEAGLGRVRVLLGGPVPLVAEITEAAQAQLALRPGEEVWASVKASEVAAHPAPITHR
jgi:NifC-like ABC-type porter